MFHVIRSASWQMGVLTGWLVTVNLKRLSKFYLWVSETLPPVLSIWLIIYSYIFITLICVETQECVWHKSAVLMLSTVGCTLKLFLCSKQNKVFVYLGCYTLHYIAMCGLGGLNNWGGIIFQSCAVYLHHTSILSLYNTNYGGSSGGSSGVREVVGTHTL